MKMFVLFVTALAVVSADIILDGPCPKLTPVMNFDMAAFQGPWYEIKKLPIINEVYGECAIADYTLVHDMLKVNHSHVNNGVRKTVSGVMTRADKSDGSGDLILSTVVADNVRVTRYWVLSTDYKNYSIIASCRDFKKSNLHAIYLWIASRNKCLSDGATKIVNNFLRDHAQEFPEDKLIENDVSNDACSSKRVRAYTIPVDQ